MTGVAFSLMKKFGIVVLFIGLFAAACTTTKKKGDVSPFKRGYHSLTTHYNYWFNANELLNLTTERLASEYTDNYTQILPLYPEAAAEPASAKSDMETVIKKAATGIGLHTPGSWNDDCYLLMGRAQYYKRDFETAENTFKFIREEYDPKKLSKTKLKSGKKKKQSASKKKPTKSKKKKSSSKKKKKKKSSSKKKTDKSKNPKSENPKSENPKSEIKNPKPENPKPEIQLTGKNPYREGVKKRLSAWPEAMVWYGLTLIEREKYDEAEFLLRDLSEDLWFPHSLRDDLAKAQAQLWIRQKRYDRAVEPLETAIRLTRRKKDRARMAFILAQIQSEAGQNERAYAALETVLRSRPEYELAFNARLSQIKQGWASGKIKSAEANRSLDRMIKDRKNQEYRDVIYYTLAEIALFDNMKPEAIGYLRQALATASGNTAQRAESYLKLADLYFEAEDFVSAKAYYDSTLTVISKDDERRPRVNTYAQNLSEIARLIKVIADNDSIVSVYNMSDVERKELAKKIRKQREEAARAQAAADKEKTQSGKGGGTTPVANAGVKASTFYFYNESLLKKGRKDFARNFGDRKLEDNWRRSQRIADGGDNENIVVNDSLQNQNGNFDDNIFKDLPRNASELSVLHLATYEAMYKLGTLYRDKIQHIKRSVATLEDMQARYPDTARYEKETWYYCHLDHRDLGNKPQAQEYLEKLLQKYPNSNYARVLSDPNFLNSSKDREREINTYYEQTFNTFQQGDYKSAFDRCTEAPKRYGSTHPIMAKFALLGAMCSGNLQGNDAYCTALNDVIGRFSETNEATRAKEIARLMGCKGFEVVEAPKQQDKDLNFALEDDKLHYFLTVLKGDDIKLDDVKNAVSDYNRENHREEQLRLSNIFLGSETNQPVIVIRKFDTRSAAMKYLNEVKNKKDFLGESNKKTYEKEFFVITQENYRRVLKNKTLDGYREWFADNYLKK